MQIIVIDDELISRKKLSEILKPFGECTEFDRGDSALVTIEEYIKNKKDIGLVAVDISMPYLNGLAVLKKIRDLEEEYSVSDENKAGVVMVTSSVDREHVMEALSKGCDDYILKPFNEEAIIGRLKKQNIIKEE